MGSAIIKVIKKNSQTSDRSAQNQVINDGLRFSKKTVHAIEDNIKGWIEDLQVRKNNDLVQAHILMGRS